MDYWDDLLLVMVVLAVRKMDKSAQCKWETRTCKEKMPPTFQTLQKFFEQRTIMLESLQVPNSTVKRPIKSG